MIGLKNEAAMDSDEFIDAIRKFVHDTAIRDTTRVITNPPGRGYPRMVADRTAWVNSLDAEGQKQLQSVIRQAVHAAVFGFLCVLDGTRIIEDGPDRGEFRLIYKSSQGEMLVNDPDDPLHDIYNSDLKL
jgi:hypothetical protein